MTTMDDGNVITIIKVCGLGFRGITPNNGDHVKMRTAKLKAIGMREA